MKREKRAAVRTEAFLFPWPIGVPDSGIEIPDPREEPGPTPSQEPDFGDGPCGEAAARLWQEHLDDPFARLLGPSPAHEQYLKERADRCREMGGADFNGPCARTGELAFARCIILGEQPADAKRKASIAVRLCEALRQNLPDAARFSWGPIWR